MSITLGELLIKLTAKTDAFQKGMSDAKRLAFDSSSDIVSSLGRIGESLAKLKFDNLNQVAASLSRVGGIIAGTAVGIAAASIAAAEHVAVQAKEIDKLSQSYGLSVQQISSFRVASELTGVPLETLSKGMGRLAVNAATVAESVGGHTSRGAAAAFQALRVSVTDSHGKLLPLNDLLGTVAEKFSRMQDSTTKTALAIQLFGRGGAALIPFLNEGKEGLERLRQVSDELGLTWTEKDIKAARAFGESVEILKLKGTALEEQFAKGLIPALDQMVNAFGRVDAAGNSAAQDMGSGIGEVFKFVGATAEVLGHDIAKVALELDKLGSYTQPFFGFSKAGAEFRADIDSQITALDKQLDDFFERINKPLALPEYGYGGNTGDVPGLGNAQVAIKNWNEIAAIIKQINDDELKLSKTTTAEIFELEEKITKELRDQHALRDFSTLVNLKFNPVIPEQSTENTTRDQFNADRLKKYNESIKDTQNLLRLQADVFESTETSADKYNFALQQLGVLLQKRLIDQETFNRAVNNLGTLSPKALDGAKAFFQQYADAAKETGRQIYDALSNAFEGINNNLAEMIVKGKADWKSLLDDIETSIVKIGLQKLEGSLITSIGKLFGIDLGSGKPTGASGDPIHTIVDNSNDFGSVGSSSQGDTGGGLLGGILGKIAGFFGGGGGDVTSGAASDPGFFSGGQRANGGPVSAGVLYRVNERGRDAREYFKPNVSGHVIPLGQMAAGGGGFTFAPTYYITTPNADTFRKSQHQLITEGLDSANRAQRKR